MPTKKILESHPVSVLKKEISMTNIKGYSKMKKGDLIELMMKPEHKDKFHHIEMARPKVSKKEQAKNEDAFKKFIADGEAKNKLEDKPLAPPKKSKAKPKRKAKVKSAATDDSDDERKVSKDVAKSPALTVTKADGTVKELKMKKKREYRRTVGKKSK